MSHKYVYTKQFSKSFKDICPDLYEQGRNDHAKGFLLEDNPWKRGTLNQAEAWEEGWKSFTAVKQSSNDLSDVETHSNLPEGTFTKSAKEIVDALLKYSKDRTQAIRRINFYINRAGDNLSNADEVLKAKEIIESQE